VWTNGRPRGDLGHRAIIALTPKQERASWVNPDGGYSYFFSPDAARNLEAFVKFWEGFGCPEPTNLHHMGVVLLE